MSGQPIGGFVDEGVRKQDPNDRIPHQHRRDLRGLGAIFSWLKHTDVKTSNTLDAWVEQAGTSGLGYVVHYQLDFGNALGVRAWQGEIGDDGYSYVVDPRPMALNLVTLGIATHRWEERRPDRRYGLGLFETDHFDPAAYKGRVPYLPIELMDRFDALWATRLVAALTPQHIAAAVAAAELSDRRVAAELTHALVVRQRKLAAYWFSKANPLDRFEVVPGDGGRAQLCFDDLLLRYKLSGTPTRYRAVGYDHAGDPTGRTWVASPDRDGRACVADIRPSSAPDGYTIIRIETWRDGHEHDHGPVLVHLALDPEQMLRPIGVRRQ